MSIELTDGDLQLLRACPFDLTVVVRPRLHVEANLRKMRSVTRLQRAGLVSVTVVSRTTQHITIRDAGRIAIGLPPIETPAAEAV